MSENTGERNTMHNACTLYNALSFQATSSGNKNTVRRGGGAGVQKGLAVLFIQVLELRSLLLYWPSGHG